MSSHQFAAFKNLHKNDRPLILLNCWDAASALVLQQLGVKALATSSASMAWANGYADGSKLPFSVLLDAVSKIMRVIDVPLTVDIEDGYSQCAEQVATYVAELSALGVCGINIEDGDQSPDLLIKKIRAIRSISANRNVFINARTDVYLRQLVPKQSCLVESVQRLENYQAAGADGAFVPGIAVVHEVTEISNQLNLPLNMMLSNFDEPMSEYSNVGVSRISFGPATFLNAFNQLAEVSAQVLGVKSPDITYDSINLAME